MNEKRLAGILNRCLDEIAAGETAEACLALHPEYAVELRPLLAMANELSTLGKYQVSDAARLQAKSRLRRAASARRDQRASSQGWLSFGSSLAARAAAGLAAILLCVLLATGMVAASEPGDLAYGLRVTAERIPARLTSGAEARARAELEIADRRLADLDRTMHSQNQNLDERTVSALLTSVEVAAELATSLPEPERTETAARIAEQAQRLGQLRQFARHAQHAQALQDASGRAIRAAERAGAGPVSPSPQPPGSLHEPTRSPSATPRETVTPTRTPSPRASATAIASPTPAPSASPSRVAPGDTERQRATPQARPTVTAGKNTPQATPARPGPAATSPGPGPAATPSGPDPAATSPGPGPASPGPGPGSPPDHTPGPATTPSGPDPAATSPGPGSTSPDPGPGSPPDHTPKPRGYSSSDKDSGFSHTGVEASAGRSRQ